MRSGIDTKVGGGKMRWDEERVEERGWCRMGPTTHHWGSSQVVTEANLSADFTHEPTAAEKASISGFVSGAKVQHYDSFP